jgi:hypothetical protein
MMSSTLVNNMASLYGARGACGMRNTLAVGAGFAVLSSGDACGGLYRMGKELQGVEVLCRLGVWELLCR